MRLTPFLRSKPSIETPTPLNVADDQISGVLAPQFRWQELVLWVVEHVY